MLFALLAAILAGRLYITAPDFSSLLPPTHGFGDVTLPTSHYTIPYIGMKSRPHRDCFFLRIFWTSEKGKFIEMPSGARRSPQ